MEDNKPAVSISSSEKRNLGFVKLRRGYKKHLHRSLMSSNAVVLFTWFLLSAYHSGPKRGCVEANIEDLMIGLGWTRSMVKRTLAELVQKCYILFEGAANQHELGTIKITKFDTEETDSAKSTGEPSKNLDDSAQSTARLTAQSTGEPSTEPSKLSISQSKQDLQVPKNAVEVKNEKNEKLDAVRRPVDAEHRPPYQEEFSPSEKKKKLLARLAAKIREQGDLYLDYITHCKNRSEEHPFSAEEREAFAATLYKPDLTSPVLSVDFVEDAVCVYDENRGKGLLPGILCSKIIDYCERERKSNQTLGCDGGHYYPPDFVDHRDRLRAKERASEQCSRALVKSGVARNLSASERRQAKTKEVLNRVFGCHSDGADAVLREVMR